MPAADIDGAVTMPQGGPDYLCVDAFLATEIEARALAFAFEKGIIDRLVRAGDVGVDAPTLSAGLGLPSAGERLVLELLRTNGVIAGDRARLTPRFRAALAFRDLLEAKLAFAGLVAADVQGLFPYLVGDVADFMARSRTFELFRYDRCAEASPAAVAAARRWVGFTSALTRYESAPCLEAIDIGRFDRLLDVGGNSGEFALQACLRSPHLRATVFDLPAVCAIGREHVSGSEAGRRIAFVAGDARRDEFPQDHDLVTFKSVLHDWPEAEACLFLEKAARALRPGGTLVVFERAPLTFERAPTYAAIPNLVFLHFLRDAGLYTRALDRLGFEDVQVRSIELETPFHLVTARKPS